MELFRKKPAKRESPPRDLPLAMTAREVVATPTGYGYLFIGVLAAMLAGAMNYSNNMAMFLVFLLGSMGFISVLHTIGNIVGIRIDAVTARPVFAGFAAMFEVRIHPGKKARAVVELAFPGEEKRVTDLTPSRVSALKIPCSARRRGRLRPGPLVVSTVYPMGLFRCMVRIPLDASCLVYPAPLAGEFTPFVGGGAGGDREDGKGPGADDFKGLKPYQPGDSPKRIFWRAFSRGQGLVTKEFTGMVGASPVLDFDKVDEAGTERKLSRLCHMVLHAQRLNLAYGLELPGTSIEPDLGEAHGRACLSALALFAPPEADP